MICKAEEIVLGERKCVFDVKFCCLCDLITYIRPPQRKKGCSDFDFSI